MRSEKINTIEDLLSKALQVSSSDDYLSLINNNQALSLYDDILKKIDNGQAPANYLDEINDSSLDEIISYINSYLKKK